MAGALTQERHATVRERRDHRGTTGVVRLTVLDDVDGCLLLSRFEPGDGREPVVTITIQLGPLLRPSASVPGNGKPLRPASMA